MSRSMPRLIIVRHGMFIPSRTYSASLFPGETEWSLNGSDIFLDMISRLLLTLPAPSIISHSAAMYVHS